MRIAPAIVLAFLVATTASGEWPVSESAARLQLRPDVAVGDEEVAFVWEEGGHVLFGRATFDGRLLDAGGIELGAGGYPRIVFDGNAYLAVWRTEASLLARRVSPHGILLGASTILGDDPSFEYDAATDGSEFVIVWSNRAASARATIVRDEQVISVAPIAALRANTPVSVAWNGAEFVIVARATYEFLHHVYPSGLRTILIDRDGNPVTEVRQATPSYEPWYGFVAGGGGMVLLAYDIRGHRYTSRIDRDGRASAPVEIGHYESADCPGTVSDLAWTGSGYVIAANGRRIDARSGPIVTVFARIVSTADGSAQRAFFDVSPAPRSRAVSH
jgi:hypothetical protein